MDTDETEVKVRNLPPIADAGGDLDLFQSAVLFDGCGSWDTPHDLSILKYNWDFGDGEFGNGKVVYHNYSSKGDYGVTLTVTDDNGLSDSDSITVSINNLSPVAVIQASKTTAFEDEDIIFDGTGSFDKAGEILDYNWHFGDGQTYNDVSAKHNYTSSGSYLIKLEVEDNENIIGTSTLLITIENLVPTANAGADQEVYVGESVRFDGSNSSDSWSDVFELRYHWDFGDNATGDGVRPVHIYTNPGVYEVTLRVIDDDNSSAIHRIFVYVREVLLTSITITSELRPTTCSCGEQVKLTGKIDFEFIRKDFDADYTITPLRVEILETGESWLVHPNRDGNYDLKFKAPESEGTYQIKVSITRLGVFAADTVELNVVSSHNKGNKQYFNFDLTSTIMIASIGTAAGGLGAFTVGTDLGRYKFFTLMIPLYTRLNREALLDNFTRGRIFEHIRTNPGMHYRAIRENLGLSNGSLAYHLRVLEKEDYIQSSSDGLCKRFYPRGMKITAGEQHNNIQELILDKIYERPFITQKELAAEIGIDISTVNYHVNLMAGAGIIKAEKFGRIKHYVVEAEIVEPIS